MVVDSSGPQWLKGIAAFIQAHRRELEELLNKRRPSDQMRSQAIRLGIVRHRLYLWRRDTQEDNWLNLYGQETFYLCSYEARKTLIDDTRDHLHLGARHLSRLIKQITYYPGRIIHQLGRIADLSGHHTRFKGETLHLLLDATDRALSQIRPTISHIGGTSPRGQIYKPQFPTIEPLRTRLVATMLSDGHLARDGALVFAKADPSRRQLVKEMLAQLGEVRFQKSPSPIVLRMPTLLGRLLKKWGMPVGDKPLQDVRLPPSIREGSIIVKCAYLEEVIPEDGSFIFNPRVKRGMFQIARNIAIRAGQKEERYPLQTGFSSKDLQFLKQWGVSRCSTLSNHPHGFTAIHLTYGRLRRLTQSSDDEVAAAARRLQQLILSRPCQLLVDEVGLCRCLGIGMRASPTAVRLYLTSGRVSVTWQTQTTRKEDALRFGLLAPPHDHRHRSVFLRWAASEPELVEKLVNQLRREGLELRLSNLTWRPPS